MKRIQPHLRRAGVTLTELLVVLVIISILSSVALPVYINDAERARTATAQLEVKMIAESMEKVGAIHGYYVPIQLLDDLPGGALTNFDLESDDSIGNESGVFLIDFNQPLFNLSSSQPQIGDDASRVDALVQKWQGPFMSFQRTAHDPNDSTTFARFDHPLDPWGRPYRFFSPIGPIGSGAINDDPNSWQSSGFSDGIITRSGSFDFFDRYAVVSFGPDGEPPVIGGQFNDDIYYEFGVVRAETGFNP